MPTCLESLLNLYSHLSDKHELPYGPNAPKKESWGNLMCIFEIWLPTTLF